MTQTARQRVAAVAATVGAASLGGVAFWVQQASYRRARAGALLEEPGQLATVSPLLLGTVFAACLLFVIGGGYLVSRGGADA